MDYTEKMQTYMEALEEERRKILVFQRELPLCLELVTQAIETCKQQLSGTTCEFNIHGGQSDCNSEQTSTEGPVLEEFIPIKRSRSEDIEQEQGDENNNEQYSYEHPKSSTCCSSKKNKSEKSDWLRSAQLWNNQTPDLPSKNVNAPRRVSVVEVKRNGGAFQPFHRDKSNPTTTTNTDTKTGVEKSNQSLDKDNKPQSSVHTAATSSTAETVTSGGVGSAGEGGSNRRDEKGGQTQRKQRRSWSPELHRRFLQALQQLGGSHAATPKQIRELMKVDGLTNDEVKSHLQKYRLHTRRPSPTPTIHQNANPPPPQFVVVGGIWVPPPEYAAVTGTMKSSAEAATFTAANEIYAPVAAPSAAAPQTSSVTQQPKPKQSEPSRSEGRDSHSAGHVRCNSPSTSSSTHTCTASPVY